MPSFRLLRALLCRPGFALVIILAACLVLSCQPRQEKKPGPTGKEPVIFASIPPQAYLLKSIAGPEFNIRILIEPGQDPHHWLPSPKQTLALHQAVAWFPSGLPFEKKILSGFENQKASLRVFPPVDSDLPDPQPETESSSDHHHQSDPHSWMSPPWLIEQAVATAKALGQLDPEKAALYRDRANSLGDKIATLDMQLKQQLSPYRGRSFLILHPALGHFAHTYGLEQNVIQPGDASPDPKRLREIIKQAQRDKTATVFTQPQFDDQSARMVAKAIAGRVANIDPLAEDVLANLKQIGDTLVDTFSQEGP
jgi:zinc transport system substrate-binding protein